MANVEQLKAEIRINTSQELKIRSSLNCFNF